MAPGSTTWFEPGAKHHKGNPVHHDEGSPAVGEAVSRRSAAGWTWFSRTRAPQRGGCRGLMSRTRPGHVVRPGHLRPGSGRSLRRRPGADRAVRSGVHRQARHQPAPRSPQPADVARAALPAARPASWGRRVHLCRRRARGGFGHPVDIALRGSPAFAVDLSRPLGRVRPCPLAVGSHVPALPPSVGSEVRLVPHPGSAVRSVSPRVRGCHFEETPQVGIPAVEPRHQPGRQASINAPTDVRTRASTAAGGSVGNLPSR